MQIRCHVNRVCVLLLLAAWGLHAATPGADAPSSARLTYYVQLIRATDQERRQEATWKPVGPKLSQRLSPVFRWKRYWEVVCQPLSVEEGKVSRSRLSDLRQVEIEMVNPSEIEIRIFVKGKMTQTSRQLIRTHMAIMGGERTKDEAWFVVVRRDKPQ